MAEPADTVWANVVRTVMAFSLVCIAWAFFRADSVATALDLLGRVLDGWSTPTELLTVQVVLWISVGLATQFIPHTPAERIRAGLARWHAVPLGVAAALFLFILTTLGPRGVAPFIYFQF